MEQDLTFAVIMTGLAALIVRLSVWLWRDMRQRQRPIWLRVLVVDVGFIPGVGFVVWLVDLQRHPHDPNVSRWDVFRQR